MRFGALDTEGKREVAELAGVSVRTLSRYEKNAEAGKPPQDTRGRKPHVVSDQERALVLATLQAHHGKLGLEVLWSFHRSLPREAVERILKDHQQLKRKERRAAHARLQWRRAGRVWAIDHKVPPRPVDGEHRAVISGRDLGAGAVVLWNGERGQRAEDVERDLEAKFEQYGPPLVLRSDNGSAFISEALQALCERWGVIPLWNPPRTPSYNGAVESGIRWLSERSEAAAESRGCPGAWTSEDLRKAKDLTNALPRDPRRSRLSRWEEWERRAPITPEGRQRFQAQVQEERQRARAELGLALDTPLSRVQRAKIDRKAVRRALVAHGVLVINKGSIPLRD